MFVELKTTYLQKAFISGPQLGWHLKWCKRGGSSYILWSPAPGLYHVHWGLEAASYNGVVLAGDTTKCVCTIQDALAEMLLARGRFLGSGTDID
jgi:hypothetical protein